MVAAMSHLLLIDASGFAHRAFYAGARRYRSDGLPVWAVVGFLGMTYALLRRAQADAPTHGAAVFDAPGKTFRHKLFAEYKANRPASRREELTPQMPFMRHAAEALGLVPVEASGFEADDVIATLTKQAVAQGIRVTVVSSDKDFCQLVKDGWVEIIEPMERKRLLEANVRAKFGVVPALVPDVQALWGDDVDGIPGIDGIGGKTAGRLIHRFGGLERLLAAAGKSGQVIETATIKRRLHREADKARLYRDLATLHADVTLTVTMDDLVTKPIERDHLREMLRVLEATDRFDVMFGGDPGVTMRVKHNPAGLAWWHKAVKASASNIAVKEMPIEPQDGFYKRRLVRGGPWVGGRIWREAEKDFVTDQPTGWDIVKCEVAGKARHPLRQWDALARFPISKKDFDLMTAVGAWAKEHAPDSSEAKPHQPIDWNKEEL